MKLLLPVAATAVLSPLAAQAWSMGPRYYGAFPMLDVFPANRQALQKRAELIQKQQAEIMNAFKMPSSPHYEIDDTDEKFSVALDVPGVLPSDIHVNLENNGKVLSIVGSRKTKDETSSCSSKFSQSFLIDPTVIIDKFEAKLLNGVLTIEAPKKDKKEDTMEIKVMEIKEPPAEAEEEAKVTVESESGDVEEPEEKAD